MDQGKAAVLSAAITGVVGIIGAICAFAAGKASAKGVVEGVKLQLSDARDLALWTDRRNAYASFLAAADEVRIALKHALRIVGSYLEEGLGSGQAATEAHNDLKERHKELLFRQAVLRLSVDDPEIAKAWELVGAAGEALEGLDGWADAVHAHRDDAAAWNRFTASREEFEAALTEWAATARARLAESGPSSGQR
ncbi:hypothetical protein ABZ490_51480 [Streptomyces sp. NPDC005811]|uniref:hypothetical protein n=1 Tax=Streptomyces sp. NPDC005811 TaxID=3154565 RepID=UPI0034043A61